MTRTWPSVKWYWYLWYCSQFLQPTRTDLSLGSLTLTKLITLALCYYACQTQTLKLVWVWLSNLKSVPKCLYTFTSCGTENVHRSRSQIVIFTALTNFKSSTRWDCHTTPCIWAPSSQIRTVLKPYNLFTRIGANGALQCGYCNRGQLDKVDQLDHKKITIHS